MPRFHKLLEQEYLKLDIKGDELNDIQKNLIDKMVSSGKAKYEGMEKMCGIISYDVDGKKGKYIIFNGNLIIFILNDFKKFNSFNKIFVKS